MNACFVDYFGTCYNKSMDYLAHGLWSYGLFHKLKQVKLAVLFGLLPDSMSWLIFAIYKLIVDRRLGEPDLNNIPDWTFTLYNIIHSLFVAGACILIVFLVLKKFPVYMISWPIAIVFDLFTHSRDFLSTPFLWPVSEWKFPGISWGNGWFMIGNYLVLLILFIYIFWKKRQMKIDPAVSGK